MLQGRKCRKTGNQPKADAIVFRVSSKWQRNSRFLPFRESQGSGQAGLFDFGNWFYFVHKLPAYLPKDLRRQVLLIFLHSAVIFKITNTHTFNTHTH